jgi:hypothetical protein
MMGEGEASAWTQAGSIVTIESPWVRLLCERWLDDRGAALEYWRVERAHSLVIVPIWHNQILFPRPQFRPGVGRLTLDLPGGRVPPSSLALEAAPVLLQKELGIAPAAVVTLELLDEHGWVINSSFSNQLLYGVVARIDDDSPVDSERLARAVSANATGVMGVLRELECLQCRAVLQEWLLRLHVSQA